MVELEQFFPLVAVVHPLMAGVLHVLSRQLVLQFEGHYRDAVHRQHHVDGIVILRRVCKLTCTLHDVLLVVQVQLLIQRTGWFEIYQLELEAQVIDAIA